MKKRVSLLICCVLACAILLSACGGQAATSSVPAADKPAWPQGDITVYVPAGAGGASDVVARMITNAAEKVVNTNFVVVNDTTGANSVAYEAVRTAKPDGSTLMLYHSGMCSQCASGQYNHKVGEFTILGTLTDGDPSGCGLYVNGDSPFNTLEDFINYAKENPGKLTGGVEVNNLDDLLTGMMAEEFGIELNKVSAGSNAEKIPLLLGNNLDFILLAAPAGRDYVESGDFKCLAAFGSARSPLLPEVPCFAELGYKPLTLDVRFFLLGPADMPAEVCAAIDEMLQQINKDQTVIDGMSQMDLTWTYQTQEEAKAAVLAIQESYDAAFAIADK